MTIKGKAYIAGASSTRRGRPTTSRSPSSTPKSAQGALADAGLTKDDVDGYFCAGDAPGLGRALDGRLHGSQAPALRHDGDRRLLLRRSRRPRRPSHRRGQVRCRADHPGRTAARRGHGHRHRAAQLRRRSGRRVRVSVRPTTVNQYAMAAMRHMHRVRHHERTARVDQGRRLAPRPAQPARPAARRGHGRGRASARR